MSHSVRYTCSRCCRFIAIAVLLPAVTQASDPKIDDAEWRVVVEDSESYQLGLERLHVFGKTEPYLGVTPSTDTGFNNNCTQLNRQCLIRNDICEMD